MRIGCGSGERRRQSGLGQEGQAMPMEPFDELLGRARWDRLASDDREHDVRITELERLVAELQAEARLAAADRKIKLEQMAQPRTW